ncbi:tail-specific protease [Puniceicoccales bacterium CK1056]|uniref:Tail-specific protease n=1 Tax=Oceanipulchritudo coccoides TaxID=2706888 RepID=A0A6B2LYG0_9BACT|nr:carboxy terminal-processing peptidase [Oceanipulchritudo coccoides]NDV61701.1 tail-specific protease [Oceanipulchritudo coccoides]
MIRAIIPCLILSVLASSLYSGPITIDKRERDQLKKETVYAIDLIQRYHYKQTSFSDIDTEELLKGYMDDLDRSRMFFLQEDVDFTVERFGSSLKSSYLYIGDLYPAFEIFNTYYERISERIAWIQERLQEPFDFESDELYLTDRSEVEWPASVEEADRLWEDRLTHELIMELLEDEPMELAIEKISKRYDRMKKFLDEIEVHNVQETFITSLAQLYDPHSNFFSWDSAQEFDIQISNALVGIGAQLRDVDGYCVIESLIPGGPAEMSGNLHPGDKIIAVAQGEEEPVDVVDMKLRKIVQQIRGETGTEVRLTVIPAHSAKRKIVPLIREKVELTANLATGDLYELPDESGDTRKVGVIELPSFYGEGAFGKDSISTSKDVEQLIGKFKDEGVDGLVLDLRRNGGGRLDEAVKLTGLFISEGPVVMKRTFNGEIEEDWDRNNKVAWDGPLVVLVSRASASASEIVAGALQSLGRAIVVGDESTHGKGTVQAPIDLRSAMQRLPMGHPLEVGTVKITVQQFYLPNGDSTQNRGVLSDIPLPSANMFLFDGEADLDNALSWDQIEPITYQLPERKNADFAIARPDILESVKSISEARQAESEEFAYLKENIAWYKERHDRKSVSLNLEKRRAEKEELESKRDYFDDTRDSLSRELKYVAKSVDLDLTEKKEKAHQAKLASTPLPNGQDRENQFYQKVFYYKSPEDEKIHEIWVEYFDYDAAIKESEAIAAVLSEAYDQSFTTDQMSEILTRFKNTDRASGFDVLDPFRDVLGADLDETAMLEAMPAFFTKMVEVDPDVLLERPKLDVPLRESLRIVRDWAEIQNPIDPAKVILSVASKQDETPAPTENTP